MAAIEFEISDKYPLSAIRNLIADAQSKGIKVYGERSTHRPGKPYYVINFEDHDRVELTNLCMERGIIPEVTNE